MVERFTTEEIDKEFTFRDKSGSLECRNQRLYLKLHSENRTRKVGQIFVINQNNRSFLCYVKPEKEEDIYRKTNSWSVYHEIVKRVKTVMYQTSKYSYYTSSELILKYGEYRDFINSAGIEKKIYLNLDYWELWDNFDTNKLIRPAKTYK